MWTGGKELVYGMPSLNFWDLLGWSYGQVYSYQLKFVTQEFISRAMSAVKVRNTFMPRFSYAQVSGGVMFLHNSFKMVLVLTIWQFLFLPSIFPKSAGYTFFRSMKCGSIQSIQTDWLTCCQSLILHAKREWLVHQAVFYA